MLVHCQVVRVCQVVLFLVGQVVLVHVQRWQQQQLGQVVLVGFGLLYPVGAVVLGRLVRLVLLDPVWLVDLVVLVGLV